MRYRLRRRGYYWNGTGWSVGPRQALLFETVQAAQLEADRLDATVEEAEETR
jgi:hypothetical protein